MNIFLQMMRLRGYVFRARCRVKEWRLSKDEAQEVANYVGKRFGDDPQLLFDNMMAGTASLLGSRVQVKAS